MKKKPSELTPDYLQVYIMYEYNGTSNAGRDPYYSYDGIYSRLPAFRRERADRYTNHEVRRQSVMSFGLLMMALEDIGYNTEDAGIWDELKFTSASGGKPYFDGRRDIHFSLSHTKGAVMCVISGSEAGCDIESVRKRTSLYSVAKRAFTPREMSFCMRTPTLDEKTDIYNGICIDPEAFCHIWTRKEAYVKYTGEGLGGIMTGFDIDGVDAYVHSEGLGHFVWAICIPKSLTVHPVIIKM